MTWHSLIGTAVILLSAAMSGSPPATPHDQEVRLSCERLSGGPSDPRWVADRKKFGIAQPVVDDRGDIAFDPTGPTLTIFEDGDRRHVLRAQRSGSRYLTSQATGANRPGDYLISIMRDFEPNTHRFRVWLQARAGEDRWAYVEYACVPPATEIDDEDIADDDATAND